VTATGRRRRRIAAYGLCRDDAGRVALVPAGTGTWALPGATVRHGERPQAAVARSLSIAEVGVRGIRAASADQAPHPSGALVHHDRLVFDVAAAGRPAGVHWLGPDELAGLRLPAFTAEVLGVETEPAAAADPDEGWAADDGFAVDRSGPRLRLQRFSTYALASDPDGRLLLARIAPNYPGTGRWHLPGGGTDFGEHPVDALLREVTEETAQRGRVVGLIEASHRHNPAALGREGYPIDWHTVRVTYRVAVDVPGRPWVTEAAGGSTAAAAWIRPEELARIELTELAAKIISRAGEYSDLAGR
jgi:ADP-ribose pyrophosphatase YjhB (NUDIX family)